MRAIRAVALEVASQQCGALSDVREMDYVPSITELRTIAFEFIRLRAAYRCGVAFVVSNDTHYGLGRLLSALVDRAGLRIGVFRDVPEAEEWLKENNPTTPPAVERLERRADEPSDAAPESAGRRQILIDLLLRRHPATSRHDVVEVDDTGRRVVAGDDDRRLGVGREAAVVLILGADA